MTQCGCRIQHSRGGGSASDNSRVMHCDRHSEANVSRLERELEEQAAVNRREAAELGRLKSRLEARTRHMETELDRLHADFKKFMEAVSELERERDALRLENRGLKKLAQAEEQA